jgi:polyisoprenoid-binding protein YceI
MIWEIDSTHSHVLFSVRVLSVTVTKGRFNSLRGRLSIDEVNPGNSWVEAEVDAAGIDTSNWLRDTHLRSPAFFAVKRYPIISFQSTTVEQNSDSTYSLAGNLTLRGITKPAIFTIELGASDAESSPYRLTARGKINRRDFDLGQSLLVRFAAGRTVDIEIGMVAVRRAKVPGEALVTAE